MKLPEKFYIEVPAPGISEDVQKELFRRGYEWADGKTSVQHQSDKFLYIGSWVPNFITKSQTRCPESNQAEISIPDLFAAEEKTLSLVVGGIELEISNKGISGMGSNVTWDVFDSWLKRIQEFRRK